MTRAHLGEPGARFSPNARSARAVAGVKTVGVGLFRRSCGEIIRPHRAYDADQFTVQRGARWPTTWEGRESRQSGRERKSSWRRSGW